MKRKLRITLLKTKRGEFYTRIQFPNGRIYAHTEGYTKKAKAVKSLSTFLKAIYEKNYVIEDETKSQKGVKS